MSEAIAGGTSKEKWLRFFGSIPGRILLTLFMTASLCAYHFHAAMDMVGLMCCAVFLAYFTGKRLYSLAPLAILFMVIDPGGVGLPNNSPTALFIFIACAAGFLLLASKFKRRGIFAHPTTFFIVISIGGAYLASLPSLPPRLAVLITQVLSVITALIWVFVYAVMNITGRKHGTVLENIGTFNAFGAGGIPAGMGLGWLKKFETKSSAELATSQMEAARLMVFILFFQLVKGGIKVFSSSVVHAPSYYDCVKALAEGHPYSHWISLYSLIARFLYQMVGMYCFANTGVAVAKFSGFAMPQGSMNIFYSRDIADFWNRIFFYYKEVMVNFFFYPTFRYLSFLSDRLRIFLSTLAAAGFGCYIHEFVNGIGYVQQVGFAHYVQYSMTYGFYCLLLALGIGLSQIWSSYGQKREADPHFHLGRFLLIMVFYGLINTFDIHASRLYGAENGEADLVVHLKYFVYMLGGI